MTEDEMIPAKPPEPFVSALADKYPYLDKNFRILTYKPKLLELPAANEDLI